MKRTLLAAALCMSGCAWASAGATITVTNQSAYQLYQFTGSTAIPVQEISSSSMVVTAGFGIGYEFDYSISVFDQGLPVPSWPLGPFYGPSAISVYGASPNPSSIAFAPYEIGFANIWSRATCSNFPSCAPSLNYGLVDVSLHTAADAAAQSSILSGHAFVYAEFTGSAGFTSTLVSIPVVHFDSIAISSTVAAVPEPATYALLACGLLLSVAHRARSKRNSGKVEGQ